MIRHSPSKPKPKTTRRSADIIDAKVVDALRGLKLAQRALDGDVPSMLAWLSRFGGDAWSGGAGGVLNTDRPYR